MAVKKITKRWLFNSLGVILLCTVAIVIAEAQAVLCVCIILSIGFKEQQTMLLYATKKNNTRR